MLIDEFIQVPRKDQIKLLSQVCLYNKLSFMPTLCLVDFEKYQFDEQNDWNKIVIVNSSVDFLFQSTPSKSTPISTTLVAPWI